MAADEPNQTPPASGEKSTESSNENHTDETSQVSINRRRFMQAIGIGTVGWNGLSGVTSAQISDHDIELEAVTVDIDGGQEHVWKDGDLSIPEAIASLDENDTEIDNEEIQQGVDWWATSAELPYTNDKTISPQQIQQLINTWATDELVEVGELVNPTLSLTPGDEYTVEWTNHDGEPHNFIVVDDSGTELVTSDTVSEQGATQTVTFTATAEMAEYYCSHHPDTQLGTIQAGTAVFSVSNLDPTSLSIVPDDSVSVSATVTNAGDGSASQDIELRIDGQPFATQNVTLGSGDETTVSFEDVTVDSLDTGEYTYGVYSGDDSQTGTLTISASRPNIVLIMADDMGYGDTSVSPFTSDLNIPTPNLESMAANGATFTSHYNAAPVCTPTRGALLTGCYPPRAGLHPHNVYFPGADNGLHPDETTIAEVVQQQGYTTGMVGKWHLGDEDMFLPPNQGFDTYFGVPYSNDMNPFPLLEGVETIQDTAPNDQLTQLYTDQATQFIADHQDEPFFLYMPHTMPHVPLGVSDQFDGFTGQGTYADVIAELDWSVGQILDQLEQLGIADDTLVIFTSDDGPWLSKGDDAGSSGPLRGGKMSTWEGGARAPAIMQMPGRIPAGTTCDEMTCHIDFLPTMANLAGADLPDVTIDGKDITTVLEDPENASSPHDYLMYYGNGLEAIRDAAGWKYHLGSGALYDLSTDIDESDDVSAANPAVVDRLQQYGSNYNSDLQANARPEGSLSNVAYLSVGSSASQDGTTTITFTNNRDAPVSDVAVSASSPDDDISVTTTSTASFASVDPGTSVTVDVQLSASSDSATTEPFVLAEAMYVVDGEQRDTKAGEHVSFSTLDPVPDQYSTFNNGSDNPVFGSKDGSLVVEGTGGVFEEEDAYSTIYLDDGLPSNGTAVIKVTDVDQATQYSTGDLIVRNDITQPGVSPGYAIISVNQNNAEIKIDENGDGNIQSSELTEFSGGGLPHWLRIQRNGTSYVASHSLDGTTWTEVASFELEEATDLQDVGVAVTSNTDENARVEFGEFTVTSSDLGPVPDEYSTFNNGSSDPLFGTQNESLVIEGTGAVNGDSDAYSTIYLDDGLPSNGTAVTKVTNVDQATQYSTGDLIVRNDVTNTGVSPGYAILSVNQNNAELKVDANGDGYIQSTEIQEFSGSGLPRWLRMERDGTSYVASHSPDGSTWTEVATFDLAGASVTQDVGIAVTSSTDENARVEFGEFTVTGSTALDPLPAEYSTFNNGSADPTYGTLDGTLYIEGTGKSAGNVDEYTAVYLDDGLSDAGTAVAKINSVEMVSEYSTAGFIVRNDVTQHGSSLGYAQAAINGNGGELKFDANANGYLDEQGSTFGVDGLPAWIRLVRNGTSFTLSSSPDGSTWTEIATFTLENATAVQDIGIAVTAPVEENTAVEIEEFQVTNS